MPRKPSVTDAVILALIAVLAAAGVALGGGSSGGGGDASTAGARAAAAQVRPIARRVEQIRGLRFKRLPQPVIVTAAETRAASLRDLDRGSPPAARQAAAQVLELLGLLKPGTDLRSVAGDVGGEQVAGYYDTRRKRLAIVAGPVASDSATSEITLAHELDHALDDQRIGLRDVTSAGADDAVSAYTALVEGVATAVMDDYARRFIDPGALLGSAFSSLGPSASATGKIPPYLLSSLLFSYVSGERFVNRLRAVAHGWKLVNYALRSRAPASTEQVIHPEKYIVDERPVRVVENGVRRLLPPSWRRTAHGTIGEFDTDQLLKLGVPAGAAGDAAAGWGGGTYELWAPAAVSGSCPSPCRAQSALVVSWVWDTPADAAQFNSAIGSYVVKGVGGHAAGPDTWMVDGGAAAVSRRGLTTTLAFAPGTALATRLASGALGR